MKKKSNKYQYGHCVLDRTLNQANEGKGTASRNPIQLSEGGDTEETTRKEREGPGRWLWLALRAVFMQGL